MSACQIDGKQCTACCRTITLPYSRRKLMDKLGKRPELRIVGGDIGFVLANWKPVKRRIAKKKNPHQVLNYDRSKTGQKWRSQYWHCTKVTDTGCSVYDSRPRVCSDFPLYGHNYDTLAKIFSERQVVPEYHPLCTEYPRIPVTDITQPAGPSLAKEIQ